VRKLLFGVLLMMGLGSTACTDDGADEATSVGPADVPAVLAEVEGLDDAARRERLVELVEAEGGSVSFYTSMSADNAEAVAAAFENAYDVDVALFRADSEAVAQRIREESAAGVQGADVVEAAGLLLESLDAETFSDYDSPYHGDLIEGADHGHWTADQLDVFVLSWNPDAVAEAERPTSWEDLADPRWQGRLAMEVDDIEWYVGLHGYWVQEGKTAAEADALFEAMAANARFVKGHSLMAQLLASGEFDVAASNYVNRVKFLSGEGAPIAYEPVVQPVIATPSGVALMDDNAHPAASVLLADWLISDAQEVFQELDIVPARADLQTTGGAEMVSPDVASLAKDFERWVERYDRLIGGGEVIDDEE
jgi:iron(III) transport system substrate-binding protein